MDVLRILKGFIKDYRWRLVFTYLLYTLEMTGSLVRPFLIGIAINDLIQQRLQGLLYLVGVHLMWLVIAMIRHRVDTRTYTAIYNDVIRKLLSIPYEPSEVSKLSARSVLSKDLVDFLEHDVYFIIEAGFSIFGSLVLLAWYQSSIIWLCLAVLLPVSIFSYRYSRQIARLQRIKNDELERQVQVIASSDVEKIHTHYKRLRTWQIRISDQESINFGFMEMIVLIVVIGSIVFSAGKETILTQAGDFVGIYFYVYRFTGGLDTIPYALQRWSVLSDIIRRLDFDKKPTLRALPQEVGSQAA